MELCWTFPTNDTTSFGSWHNVVLFWQFSLQVWDGVGVFLTVFVVMVVVFVVVVVIVPLIVVVVVVVVPVVVRLLLLVVLVVVVVVLDGDDDDVVGVRSMVMVPKNDERCCASCWG